MLEGSLTGIRPSSSRVCALSLCVVDTGIPEFLSVSARFLSLIDRSHMSSPTSCCRNASPTKSCPLPLLTLPSFKDHRYIFSSCHPYLVLFIEVKLSEAIKLKGKWALSRFYISFGVWWPPQPSRLTNLLSVWSHDQEIEFRRSNIEIQLKLREKVHIK